MTRLAGFETLICNVVSLRTRRHRHATLGVEQNMSALSRRATLAYELVGRNPFWSCVGTRGNFMDLEIKKYIYKFGI